MLSQPFEVVIKNLCEEILSETDLAKLPQKIISHIQDTFPVESATLWLTGQTEACEFCQESNLQKDKKFKLVATTQKASALLAAYSGQLVEGFIGSIAKNGCPVNITNPDDFKNYFPSNKFNKISKNKEKADYSCRCVLGVPLLFKSLKKNEQRVIGVLEFENIENSDVHPETFFTDADVNIVTAYASVIAVALEKAQMKVDLLHTGNGLLEISKMLLESLGEQPNMKEIVEQTAKVISANACALWKRNGNQLVLDSSFGYSGDNKKVPYFDNILIPNDKYMGVGLTVFVANTLHSLNLENKEAIREHIAWNGSSDAFMGDFDDPLYSFIAIPLIDEETRDLKGVLRIENKQPTIFQPEKFFTKDEQSLLETLGNSISLALIIFERFNRLKRLEKLVGNFRLLKSHEESFFFILTGLTHNGGLQYNRSLVFMNEKGENDEGGYLVCKFAIGCLDREEWTEMIETHQKEVRADSSLDSLKIDFLLDKFSKDKSKYYENPLAKKWNGIKIPVKNSKHLIAEFARSKIKNKTETEKYISGCLEKADIFYGFSLGDFVLIPIYIGNELIAIIYADNFFTGNRINKFEKQVLDLFAGMAAAIINASEIPDKLRKENESAWKEFSQPAAHRLGTETNIIGTEVGFIENDYLTEKKYSSVLIQVDEIKNSLGIINNSVERLRQATNDYKQLTPEPENPSAVNLIEVITNAVKSTVQAKNVIEIEKKFPSQDISIEVEATAIKYVFEEMLLNAEKELQDLLSKKATFKPKITIIVEETESEISIFIGDNGRGIPQKIVNELFRKPIKGRPGGTGLGLFLNQRIIRRNGGTIKFINAPYNGCAGACFRISFSKINHSAQMREENTENIPHHLKNIFTKSSCPLALIIEDNPILQHHLTIKLAQNDIACILANNEDEALKKITENITIVIADICLNETGGREDGGIFFAQELKKNGITIPIILISQTPWQYLPPPSKKQEHGKILGNLGVKQVFDRNDRDFYPQLIKAIKKEF